jgi:PAS domain S-box-containing protein
LNSIGDAIIATDADGRIQFLNPIAESLCGWGSDAIGKPLSEVFHIIHAKTRAVLECPFDRVQRERTAVNLDTGTLLVARDKTEMLIDDTAAPIFDRLARFQASCSVFGTRPRCTRSKN